VKVVTILGTRPEIIRLSRVMAALDKGADHIVTHTGQNYDYELNQIFYDDLDLRPPDEYLDAAGATAAETIAQVIVKTDALLRRVKPDAVLLLGDTNSCMAAIPAKKLKIPIFHMEAGNRCFDQRVPEETNRRIVDHIADINLPYSSIAREYLLREGIPPDRIIKTGSPMREVLEFYSSKIDASDILSRLNLRPNEYFVVSAHREENVDDEHRLAQLGDILEGLAKQYALPVIVSAHPRTQKRLDAAGRHYSDRVRFLKPFAFTDYVRLQQESKATLSDSGTITEESAILGFPALNIRDAHERPEGMEAGAVMMTGLFWSTVKDALEVQQAVTKTSAEGRSRVQDYTSTDVSQKVVWVIRSYIDYVNSTVWRKAT
jgi:UDP-N-acetyl-L-fucosamine synthase